MYVTKTHLEVEPIARPFENDVKMYVTKTTPTAILET